MQAEMGTATLDRSRVILPDEGERVNSRGETMLIKLKGSDTDGTWSMVQATLPAMSFGPPLHINTMEDEAFFVIEGALRMQIGERVVTAKAGTLTYVPKGMVHTFCNPFNQAAVFLGIISPAGFENYFVEVAALVESTAGLSQEEIMSRHLELITRYGGVPVGPPMSLDPAYGN